MAGSGKAAGGGGKGTARATRAQVVVDEEVDFAVATSGRKGRREKELQRVAPAPVKTEFSDGAQWGRSLRDDAAGGGGGLVSPGGGDFGLGTPGGSSRGGDDGGGNTCSRSGGGSDLWSSPDDSFVATSPLSSPSLFSRLGEGLGLFASSPAPGPDTAGRHSGGGGLPESSHSTGTARRSGGLLSVPLSRCRAVASLSDVTERRD